MTISQTHEPLPGHTPSPSASTRDPNAEPRYTREYLSRHTMTALTTDFPTTFAGASNPPTCRHCFRCSGHAAPSTRSSRSSTVRRRPSWRLLVLRKADARGDAPFWTASELRERLAFLDEAKLEHIIGRLRVNGLLAWDSETAATCREQCCRRRVERRATAPVGAPQRTERRVRARCQESDNFQQRSKLIEAVNEAG